MKLLKQKVIKNPVFFFFIWSSSKILLYDSFITIFIQNSSIYTKHCTTPSLFDYFEVSQGIVTQELWLLMHYDSGKLFIEATYSASCVMFSA